MSILAIYSAVVVVDVVVVAYESAMDLYNLEYEEKIFNEIRSLHLNRSLMINRLLSIYTLRILWNKNCNESLQFRIWEEDI